MHPNRNQLESFIHGRLQEPQRKLIEQHITDCESCCEILRSIPHDFLVAGLQPGDTFDEHGETELALQQDPEFTIDSPEIPTELKHHPRYRIVEKLGAGGMGVVFRAEHRLMERPVALKVVNARLLSSEVAIERFRMEVRAAAKLSHRNIVAAHDAEQEGDVHFLVMEFIEGIDLSELIRRRGKLSVLHACNYTMQAALGLQHALERSMVHRDIKPHNLMRTPKGTIKILDFGLARFASQQRTDEEESGLTDEGATLGTPDYIAPEQARDAKRADIRADIYSLGCTLYYLLTGQPPFPSGTAMEKVLAHIEREPKPIQEIRNDLPPEIIAILQRMMCKDPALRFQKPAEVAEALKPFSKPDEGKEPTAVLKPETQTAAQITHVDRSPTIGPLDQLDLPEASPHPVNSPRLHPRSPRPSLTDRISSIPRSAILVSGAILLLAIAAILLIPLLGDLSSERASAPEQIVAPTITEDGWIDLMPQIDASRDAVAGQWSKSNGNLMVDAADRARLMLPGDLPSDYDFEVEFTRNTGRNSVALHFVAGLGQASFDIDAWNEHLAGIQSIGGATLQQNPSRAARRQLVNGQRYVALIRVRQRRVETLLNGNLIDTYDGDGSDLSMIDLWQLPDSRRIGIGSYDNSTTFHRIRIRDRTNR